MLRNYLHHNDRMAPNTPGAFDDYGAVGVVVQGDNTEVAYNTITDNWAPSADFGTDGSAVEIYGGIGTLVHHNIASNNRTFTELGNNRSADTTYAYNQVTSSLDGLRVPDHPRRRRLLRPGPRHGRGEQLGQAHRRQLPRLLLLRRLHRRRYFMLYNNVLDVAGRIGYLEGSMSGGNNVYWRGSMCGLQLMPGDRYADPQFKGSRLARRQEPARRRRPARPDEEGPRGRKVGVDGNGDGQRGTDIGAYEAKAKGHSGGKGHQGGKGHNGGKGTRRQGQGPPRPATTQQRRQARAGSATAPKTRPGGPQGVGVPRARMGASTPNPAEVLHSRTGSSSCDQPGGGRKPKSTGRPGPGGPGRSACPGTFPDVPAGVPGLGTCSDGSLDS